MTNARATPTTDAHSSATTSLEGTTAPAAMVTTWTRTNTLALVQKISHAERDKSVAEGTNMKHEVRIEKLRKQKQAGEGEEKREGREWN